jgi:hypothetical protein
MQRQRVLERAGWAFWRCFASAFIRRKKDILGDLLKTLAERGIEPIGAEGALRSVHTEHRVVSSASEPMNQGGLMPVEVPGSAHASTPAAPSAPSSLVRRDVPPVETHLHPSTDDGDLLNRGRVLVPSVKSRDAKLPSSDYVAYSGPAGVDPRNCSVDVVVEGIVRIIEVEGPVVAKRVYDIYLESCGIKRMGNELKRTMNKALALAIRQNRVVSEDESAKGGILFSVVRAQGSPPIRLRSKGSRSLEEIPPSELQALARYLVEQHGFKSGSEEHLRAILEWLDLKRLTIQANTVLLEILKREFPYVEEFLRDMGK